MKSARCTWLVAFWCAVSVPALAESPIKIGVLNDMSSVYSVDGGPETTVAVQMAIDDAGPVLGQKAEVVAADHQNKPDVGSGIARRWFDVEGVDAIVDIPNSGVAFAVQEVAKERRKTLLLVGALSSDVTGPKCDAHTTQWAVDTYSMSKVIGTAILKRGGDRWFFLGADYVFGRTLVKETTDVVEKGGGKVVGTVFAPLNTADFSSFLLQAQGVKPNVIALANSVNDAANAIRQANEFGLAAGARYAAFVLFISNVKAMGSAAAQGLLLVDPFYWDMNDETRAWSKRFEAKVGHPPDYDPAISYSAVLHYLKAVQAAGTRDSDAVAAKMREMPINDMTVKNGSVRADGRVMRPLYLLEVKKPEAVKSAWDLYSVVDTIPADQAFRALKDGNCPLVAR